MEGLVFEDGHGAVELFDGDEFGELVGESHLRLQGGEHGLTLVTLLLVL